MPSLAATAELVEAAHNRAYQAVNSSKQQSRATQAARAILRGGS
jgi:hypothetical protein